MVHSGRSTIGADQHMGAWRSRDYLPFVAADSLFYDVLWAPCVRDSSERVAPTGAEAPHGWTLVESGPWSCFRAPGSLPPSGWKVHVSALPNRARAVVGRVVRLAWKYGVTVKALRTRALVEASQQKYAPPTASGKVVTAYPSDESVLVRFVAALVDTLGGEPGPGVSGEVRVANAPVYLRYGAFTTTWLPTRSGLSVPGVLGVDGLEPDRRGRVGKGVVPPEALRPLLARVSDEQIDVSEVSLVHRSNAGGVYRARWGDGRRVVLKEARRYAGVDVGGADAWARLRHERDVLERLAGTGCAPGLVGYFAAGESEFLVMEHVDGPTLARTMAQRHPGHRPDASASLNRAYAAWVDRTIARVGEVVDRLSEHGIVHGDLHPSNILETEAGVVLVDYESAGLDGRRVATGLTAPGFGDGEAGPASDRLALEHLRLTLLNSAAHVLTWRPELRERIEVTGLIDLGVVADDYVCQAIATAGDDVSSGDIVRHLLAGVQASATPTRLDRLFPADIAAFSRPDAGLGLLYGAAGVILSVRAAGGEVPPVWLDWLSERALGGRAGAVTGGFAQGELGVALALALLGRGEVAQQLVTRAADRSIPERLGPWWEHGCAGKALAYAELAGLLEFHQADEAAKAWVHQCLDVLNRAVELGLDVDENRAPRLDDLIELEAELGHAPGLLRGWAGLALVLLRLFDLGFVVDGIDLRSAAVQAIRLDARHCQIDHGALTARHGRRLLPYVGIGSAAIGLAAHCALERLGAGSAAAPGAVDRWNDEVTSELIALTTGMLTAARVPQVVGAGFLGGRAGLLAALRRVGGERHPAVRLHLERLGWHVVSLAGRYADDPGSPHMLTGAFNLRLSADLATGSAGALLAICPEDLLHDVLRLPQSLRGQEFGDTSSGLR